MDYARRTAAYRERMAQDGLDAYWLVDTPNLRYLTGFTGDDSTRNLKMPSDTGEGDARVIFTNLTNYAIENVDNAGALTLGTVSKIGPGNLSIGFGYRAFESEFNCSSTGTGSCGGRIFRRGLCPGQGVSGL